MISNIKLRQNDVPRVYHSPNGKNEHCYAMTLFVCAAVASGVAQPTLEQYLEVYKLANKKNLLSLDGDTKKDGAYVMSNRGFPQFCLEYFGSKLKWLRAGSFPDDQPHASFIVINGKTKNGGHFRELRYDPYNPMVDLLYIKSIKYYLVR